MVLYPEDHSKVGCKTHEMDKCSYIGWKIACPSGCGCNADSHCCKPHLSDRGNITEWLTMSDHQMKDTGLLDKTSATVHTRACALGSCLL